MKKILKDNLKILIVIIITSVVTSVTSILAYSLIANNVGYTPKDSSWNVDNVEAALNNLNIRTNQLSTYYLIDEQVVGKWVDGKPLYQKTINLGPLSASSKSYNISLNTTEIDKVINYNFVAMRDDNVTYINSSFISPSWLSGSCSILAFINENGNIKIEIYNGYYTIQNAYITLQYTKSTD